MRRKKKYRPKSGADKALLALFKAGARAELSRLRAGAASVPSRRMSHGAWEALEKAKEQAFAAGVYPTDESDRVLSRAVESARNIRHHETYRRRSAY